MYFCKCARTVPHGQYGVIFSWKLTFKVKIICSEYLSEHFGEKRLEKMPKGQISHSESIWTSSVGKYWKSCKIACYKSIQTTLVGKYWKSCKTTKIGHSESIQTILVGKYW